MDPRAAASWVLACAGGRKGGRRPEPGGNGWQGS